MSVGANVESKIRCEELDLVARRAERTGARYAGRLDQFDTYFRVVVGRLKLRELTHTDVRGQTSTAAELIRYQRPDETGARISRYERTPVDDVRRCLSHLRGRYGELGCVRKRRELWLLDATRIHLDAVAGLGSFVELETVASGAEPTQRDRSDHDRVASALGLDMTRAVAGSYVDLLQPATGVFSGGA
jgi:adenylate cyclase class IV